jgi:hypothetical protein
MAVGDDAVNAGFPILDGSEEVEEGYIEINRTRDFIAQVQSLIQAIWDTAHGGTGASTIDVAKVNLGFAYGSDAPSDANGGAIDGNVYFRIPA